MRRNVIAMEQYADERIIESYQMQRSNLPSKERILGRSHFGTENSCGRGLCGSSVAALQQSGYVC
jgi:hypothetical protein